MPALNSRGDALKLHELPLWVGGRIAMLEPLRTIPGVILLGASHRNGPGKGLLRSEADGQSIAWRAPGSAAFGSSVDVSFIPEYGVADYVLEDGEDGGKFVQVRVKAAYLQPAPIEQPVYLQQGWNLIFPDLTAEQAAAGGTFGDGDRELRNIGLSAISNIRAWIEPGNAGISISADGVTYSSPTTEDAAIDLGSLPKTASRHFWTKNVVPPGATSSPRIHAVLHFRFDGI